MKLDKNEVLQTLRRKNIKRSGDLCSLRTASRGIKQTEKIIINNSRISNHMRAEKNKWVAFAVMPILRYLGGHKFYEGKPGLGVLYIFTGGLFGIGWLVDIIAILCKKEIPIMYKK